jgi:hypothetical protein
MASNAFSAEPGYDLFLSYNSSDHSIVETIAQKLRDQGLKTFFDRWYLTPGGRWRPKIEQALSSCTAVAIFVGPGEMGSWQQREVDAALDLQIKRPNFPVIPVLLPGSEPPLGFLRELTFLDLRTEALDKGISILAKAARGEPPGPDLQMRLDSVNASICPYRGLLYFREEDAPFFFGREEAIDKLTSAVQRQSFVALAGSSGSGKSSVVRAGLVPRLRRDRNTTWETVILVPTDQPLKALARALVPLLEPTIDSFHHLAEAAKLAECFRSSSVSLYDIIDRILERQSGTDRVLIVVDQCEELYTLTSDEEANHRFLDVLLEASSCAGSKANIALTLRGDFVAKALAHRPLSDRLLDAQINLGPMTREELECAIRKPAEKTGLEFEPGLVRRILDDVGDEPGNLPLLQFVLKVLWDRRRGLVLTNETYDAVGGLRGAVATKADELFKGLSDAEQNILRSVFMRLVSLSEGGQNTGRRAAFSELPPGGVEVVFKLASERLLVTNRSTSDLEPTVEFANNALISNWGTFRAWVNEDREFLLWREHLGTWLSAWSRLRESDDVLLRGELFVEAQEWLDERSADSSSDEIRFVTASRELRSREREETRRLVEELERLRARKGVKREGIVWGDKRRAILIANADYQNCELRKLQAPPHDARALKSLLEDANVGAYEAEILVNEPKSAVERAIDRMLTDCEREDTALIFFGGHGIKHENGKLFFAVADTTPRYLGGTAISASWLLEQMQNSRARRQMVLLDCCFGGAVARGHVLRGDKVEAGPSLRIPDLELEADGRGQVIITAADAMQFALEGSTVNGDPPASCFTRALVKGLETGAADENEDGIITVPELISYLRSELRKMGSLQNPQHWIFGGGGADLAFAFSRPAANRH